MACLQELVCSVDAGASEEEAALAELARQPEMPEKVRTRLPRRLSAGPSVAAQ